MENKALSAVSHTPGPWEIQTNRIGEGLINRFGGFDIDSKSVNERVCSTWSTNRTDISDKANAALIAAAPELLEACREALKRGSFSFNGSEDKTRVEDLLEQAIAKAENR